MQYSNELVKKLQYFLKWKMSKSEYAKKLGITVDEVNDLLDEIGIKAHRYRDEEAEIANYIASLEEKVTEVNLKKGTLTSTVVLDFEPKTVSQLAHLHKIDLSLYKISNYWSKQKSSGKFTSSVFATLRKSTDYTPEDFAKFLKKYKSPYVPNKVICQQTLNDVDVEISIADFHLAKKTLNDKENTILARKVMFMKILENLILTVSRAYGINKLVFLISNDFFHTDTYGNTTTNGTPQDVITDFATEYEAGFDLMVEAISYLRTYCQELHVILVQGNHDRTKSFYMAHALEKYFEADEDIKFDRDHGVTKYIVLGQTFIGYHHGNCKIEDLPLLFATGKSAQLFGNSSFREVHTGDKHHYMAKEVKGVRIQQMPSLSGVDRWHLDNNYVNNIRAAIALVYHPLNGKVAEFEERIRI